MLSRLSGRPLTALSQLTSRSLAGKRNFASRRYARPPPTQPGPGVRGGWSDGGQRLANQWKTLAEKDLRSGPEKSRPEYFSEKIRPARHLLTALAFTGVVGLNWLAAELVKMHWHCDQIKTGAALFTWAAVQDFKLDGRALEDWVRRVDEDINQLVRGFYPQRYRGAREPTAGEKGIAVLIGINALVWLAWKAPVLQWYMWNFFANSFTTKPYLLPMLFSVFSHQGFLHLFVNMYVLNSFGSAVIDNFLGAPQFTAFYLTAGVFSSLVSLAHKCVTRSAVPALGASGAILALVIYACEKMPDARLRILFVPGFEFSAQSAVYGIILFDVVGLLIGTLTPYRLLDHSAHLGGALFGLWYAKYGEELYQTWLKPAIQQRLVENQRRRIEETRKRKREGKDDGW